MYGRGAGELTSVTTGAVSTVAGVAILPNTGGNPLLIALSIFSMVGGGLILASFTFTRIASLLYRK
jgi:hypothetical protein